MTATLAPSAPGAPESVVRPADANARGEWRVAARLARREVTRRWGRTLLVMLLVAVPVFGMTTLTVLVRTGRNTPHQVFARAFGQANLVALGNARPPAGGWPAGTRILTGSEIDTIGLVTHDGTARLARVTDL